MATTASIGVDGSDGEIRAAAFLNGQFAAIPLGPHGSGPIYFCDKSLPNKSIGVGFPSIVRSLGSQRAVAIGNLESRVEDLFRERLTAIRQIVAAAGRGPIGPVTLAVPAGLTGMRRRILMDCAREAGFTEVELMDRCLAAAIGHRSDAEDVRTLLVVASCYGGTDLSLIRLGKGRARVLASQCLELLGEQHLAEASLESLVLRLREENIFLGLKQLTAVQWLQFHALAGDLWRDLAAGKPAHCVIPGKLTTLSGDHHTDIEPAAFALGLAKPLEALLDAVRGLLDSAKLEVSDVEVVLLSGATAQIPLVAQPLREFLGKAPVTATANLVAFGAAFQSSQPGTAAPPPEEPLPGADSAAPPPVATPAPEVRPPQPVLPPEPTDPLSISNLRRLIDQGRFEAARNVWVHMADALTAINNEMKAAFPATPAPSPRRWVSEALEAIAMGRYAEGIGRAHQAYAADKNDPEVFAGMMQAHIEAAATLSRPQDYHEAISILECARSHDQTDRHVLKALGQRHLLHAREMRRLNNYSAARDCVTEALRYDPKNPEAVALHSELIQSAQAD